MATFAPETSTALRVALSNWTAACAPPPVPNCVATYPLNVCFMQPSLSAPVVYCEDVQEMPCSSVRDMCSINQCADAGCCIGACPPPKDDECASMNSLFGNPGTWNVDSIWDVEGIFDDLPCFNEDSAAAD